MDGDLIGYARCSSDSDDVTAQRDHLHELDVPDDRIHLDHGLVVESHRTRPGLDQALSMVRPGDTLVVPSLDRLARSVADAREIADSLADRGVKLRIGRQVYDPADPMGKVFFDAVATVAGLELDLQRMKAEEVLRLARSNGRRRGRQPRMTAKQRAEMRHMYVTGVYSVADLAEIFTVSRTTVYRILA